MPKFLIGALISLFATVTFSNTQPIFDSEQVIVILQGQAGDTDAINLFNSLTVPATDKGTFLEKQASFNSTSKEQLFSISCRVSKSIFNYGSCTLIVYKSTIAVIDPTKKFASLMIQYPDSQNAAKAFVAPPVTDQSGKIFISADSHVGIYLYRNDHTIHLFYN